MYFLTCLNDYFCLGYQIKTIFYQQNSYLFTQTQTTSLQIISHPKVKQIKAHSLSQYLHPCNQSINMSTGPFTRTNRNTPQRNLNKSQQPTQASFTPSQQSVATQEQSNGGYVYKPPTRIVRSNVNTVKEATKVQEKPQTKKEEQSVPSEVNKKQQPPLQKPASFVRKPATEVVKETTVRTTTVTTEVTEIKQQIKPTAVKSVSRLPIVRTNQSTSISNLRTPRKQEKQEIQKVEQTSKPITSPYVRTTKTLIQSKPQTTPLKNPLQQLTQDPTKTVPNLQIKKPTPFYSYPKKITKRQSQKQVEAEEQTKKEQENPKLSDQNDQAPQVFSSTYSYRNKNTTSQVSVQSVQSSQSSTNLKNPYQTVAHTPIEKVVAQTQKPASTINADTPVKPPIKTPLSHTSRYSNKVETPVKEEPTVNSEPQVSKQPVKRSPIIGFVLHRLYIQKMGSNLHQCIQYSCNIKQTKANQKIHQYFQKSLSNFIKVYERNVLTRSSFNLIKSIFSKLVKVDMTKSTDPKIANQLIANRNNVVGKVIENVVPSVLMELRFSFVKLKSNLNDRKSQQVKRQTGARILSGIEIKKLRQAFACLSDWTTSKHLNKLWKLTRCSQVTSNYKKWLLAQVWTKLSLNKLKELDKTNQSNQQSPKKVTKKPSETTVVEVSQKQPEANVELKQKVAQLEEKLVKAQQKNAQIPKQGDLRKTIQQLKQEKSVISEQIASKRQRNAQLKQRLETLISKASHQSLSSLSQQRKQQEQPTLSLLHEIYMKIHKQSEPQCTNEQNLASLCAIHRVQENSEREIVAKWLAVRENLGLKHWINLYEGNYVEEAGLVGQRRQANRQIEEENQLVEKFIRSYVKERYMWQQVKEYVAAVINQ